MFKRPARASRDACWRRLHGSRVRSRAALLLLLLLLLGGLDVLLEVKRSIGIAYTIHECHPKQLLRSIYPRFSPAFASATSHALWLLGPDSASLHARAHPASHHPPLPPQSITLSSTFATPVSTAAPPLLLSPTSRHCLRPFYPRIRTVSTLLRLRGQGERPGSCA
jgi:hypothetical protein